MPDRDDRSSPAVVRWGVIVSGTLTAMIGAFWLIAWLAGVVPAWSSGDTLTPKANNALALLLGGSALLLVGTRKADGLRRWVAVLCSATVLAAGALTLSEHLFGWDLGLDQLLATEPVGAAGVVSPNRMGPPASISHMLLGIGLIALAFRRRGVVPYLGLAVCIINLLPAVGFLYGVQVLYSKPHVTGIAWPTVIALFSLGAGLVMLRTDGGPMAMLLRDDPGGMLLRRMWPAAVLVPLVLGFLRVQGQHRGLYDTATGTGLLVLALILIFSAMLWRAAAGLSRSDAGHREDEEALGESERRYRALFDGMSEGFALCEMIWDEDGRPCDFRYLDVNRAWEQHTGITRGGVVGRTVREAIPGIETFWIESYGRVVRTGEPVHLESEVAGLHKWMEVIAYKHSDNQFAAIFQDITERKRAEEALQAAHDQLEATVEARTAELTKAVEAAGTERQRLFDVLETLPAMICLLTPDHHVAFANRSFREKFGEPKGRYCYDFCFGQKEPCHFCESYEVLKTGKPHHWEVTSPDGSTVISAHDFPFTDVDGSPLILEMDLDITAQRKAEAELKIHRDRLEDMVKDRTSQLEAEIAERKQAEGALRQVNERLDMAQRAAGVGVWDWDVTTGRIEWSSQMFELFGLDSAESGASYEAWRAVLHPDDREEAGARINRALEEHRSLVSEYRIVRPDGEIRWINALGQGTYDDEGRPVRMIGICVDITDLKHHEQHERELESHKREFYKRTILAATEGKLVICERQEILEVAGPALATWKIGGRELTLEAMRKATQLLHESGMPERRSYEFLGCITEAAANAVKHAKGGQMSMHAAKDGFMCVISDSGPGIGAMALPDVALTKNYSTAGTLGMGYKVMIHFADRVYLATEATGTTVAVEMASSKAPAPEPTPPRLISWST